MHVLDNLKIKLLFPSLDFKCFSTDFWMFEFNFHLDTLKLTLEIIMTYCLQDKQLADAMLEIC